LMMLYEECRFQLSDPVFLYLGDAWKKSKMRVWDLDAGTAAKDGEGKFITKTKACRRNITVRDLLTHTSGLSYGFDESGQVNPVDTAYHSSGFLKEPGGLADFVGKLAEMPLLFQPGSHWHYGFNTDVCAYLVEILSGKPLAEFLQERIFAPLGMVDTGFWLPPEKQHRFCDCYFDTRSIGMEGLANISKTKGQLTFLRQAAGTGHFWGGGGLVSTMHDYLRFCQCILNGGELDGARLVSVKTAEWMASNHLPQNRSVSEMQCLPAQYTEIVHPGEGFGLGFSVTINSRAGNVIGSNGVLFWGGLANTAFWIDPEEEIICIWLTQVIGLPPRDPIRNNLRQLVYACITDRKLKARL